MKKLGFDYTSAEFGLQANEFFGDAKADQQSIRAEFYCQIKEKEQYAGDFRDLPLDDFGINCKVE